MWRISSMVRMKNDLLEDDFAHSNGCPLSIEGLL